MSEELNIPIGITRVNPYTIDSYIAAYLLGATLPAMKFGGDITTDRIFNPAVSYNTFFGNIAAPPGLVHTINDTGYKNSTFGFAAGCNLTSGYHNTLIGANAGEALTTADGCTLIGARADDSGTGSANTCVGSWCGEGLTTGYQNTFMGNGSGNYVSESINCVFIGNDAGMCTSAPNLGTGGQNVFIGAECGMTYKASQSNVAIGFRAFNNAKTTSDGNVIIGFQCGQALTNGGLNIIIGYSLAGVNEDAQLNIGGLITGYLNYAGKTPMVTIVNAPVRMSQASVEPSATADRAGIYALDISAGHCALGISSEEVVVTAAAGASDVYLPIRINGATYKLLLHS